MRYLLTLALCLVAFGALAADDYYYPKVIVSTACTDTNAVPAGAALTALPFSKPTVQTTGAADGRCDHDSRISTGAITVDTTFGPFPGGAYRGYYVFVDADAVTGTTFTLNAFQKKTHDGAFLSMGAGSNATGTGDVFWGFGISAAGYNPSEDVSTLSRVLTNDAYLQLNLVGASSVTADISLVPAF